LRPSSGQRQNSVRYWVTGVALLVSLALLVAVPYALMPSLLEEKVARELKSGLRLSNEPEVNLKGSSTLGMLSGRFTGGRVVLEEPELAGIRPERVVVSLSPFDLKVPGSLLGGPESEEPLSGDVRLALSEEEVERLLSSGSEEISVESVRLKGGEITLGARVRFLDSRIPVKVRGDLRVRGRRLVFRARGIEASGVGLSDEVSDELIEGAKFFYPLEELPAGGRIRSVEISDTTLVLSGRMRNIPLN